MVLIVVEAAASLAGSVLAFAAPERVLGPLVSEPLLPQALAVTAQAAGAWAALGLALLGALWLGPGDARGLRVLFVGMLVGDLVHLGAVAALVGPHGTWSSGAMGLVAFTAVLFGYRLALVLRPALLLGAAHPPGDAGGAR